MLPTIKRPRPKEETDLAVLLQSNIEVYIITTQLQKTMI